MRTIKVNEHSEQVVTPQQYRDGWVEKIGDMIYERKFSLIRKLANGNLVVRDPDDGIERWRDNGQANSRT